MLDRFIIGVIGGWLFVGFTWLGAELELMEWINHSTKPTMDLGLTFMTPFSLLGFFLFLTMYLFPKIKPQHKGKTTFLNLLWIGFAFSFGASFLLFPLMYFDGIKLTNIAIIDGIFMGMSLFITVLISSFYIFLKPLYANPKKELLDEYFSN